MLQQEFNAGAIRPIECLKEGWEIIKSDYWILFAISLLGGLIAGSTMYVLLGPMVCGIFMCYLRKIDTGTVKFDEMWQGFKYFVPSLLVTIVFVVPIFIWTFAVFITMYLPLITMAVMGKDPDPTVILGSFGVALVIDLIVAIAMTCIHSLIMFSFPLIVDRGLSSWDAIKLSARATMKNLGGIGGLIGVQFLLVLVGMLAFCIGTYFIIPIMTATSLVAYRKVFPKLQIKEFV